MGEIVNLNRFRKRKAKDAEAREADANRIKFGRTKAEKKLSEAERAPVITVAHRRSRLSPGHTVAHRSEASTSAPESTLPASSWSVGLTITCCVATWTSRKLRWSGLDA